MNIFFEINHPGQVHLLRHSYHLLKDNGHKITVFAKNEPIINRLLSFYNISYKSLGNKGAGKRGKLVKQLVFDLKVWLNAIQLKYVLGVGSSMTNDHVSLFSTMKSIHLSDDDEDVVPLIKKYAYPFSDTVLAPDSLLFKRFSYKVISYAGTHELAYLHPNRFKPDPGVLSEAGLKTDEPYFVLRFVALKGHHDDGHSGISYENKKVLINLLKQYGRIIISAEKKLEPEFEPYRMKVDPEKIHSLIYYASLFISDSQTMTSEAATLGVPALKCNTFAGLLSVPNELEHKYGLCYSYHPNDFTKFYDQILKFLKTTDLKLQWQAKRKKLLEDKIDVTAFFVWFIENYPESFRIMKENPDYQYRFR